MLSDDEIGGAKVLRSFDGYRVGHRFTRKEWLAFPQANREAMARLEMVRLMSRGEVTRSGDDLAEAEDGPAAADDFQTDDREKVRVVIPANDTGLAFNVIEGVQINTEPLSEVDAELLASQVSSVPESAPPVRETAPRRPTGRAGSKPAQKAAKRRPRKRMTGAQKKAKAAGAAPTAATAAGRAPAAP